MAGTGDRPVLATERVAAQTCSYDAPSLLVSKCAPAAMTS
jgi:hypothetical protein